MKRNSLLLIGLLVVAFVVFFMTRPVREKACPLSKDLSNDPDFLQKCKETGGVIKDGKCTCPD